MVDTNRLIYPHEWVGIGLVSGIAYVLAKYALKERSFEAEKKNCGCGKDPCITYGAEPCGNYGAESFEAEALKITGLEKLTNEQLSNLEEWVNKYIHKSIDEIEAINDDVAYRIERMLSEDYTEDVEDWWDDAYDWMEEEGLSNELGEFLLSPTDDDKIGGWADEDILISERWDKLNPQIKLLILISISKQMNIDPSKEMTNEEKNFINQLTRRDEFIYEDSIVSIATKRKIESWLDDNYYHSPNEPIIYDIGGEKFIILMFKDVDGGSFVELAPVSSFLYEYKDEDTDLLDINLVRDEGEAEPIVYSEENSYLFRFLDSLEYKSKTELQYIAENRDLSQTGTKKILRTRIAEDIFFNELAILDSEKYISSVRNFVDVQNEYSPAAWGFLSMEEYLAFEIEGLNN
tara:strand:- start:2829 stop:4043 length:1215 start_codon:yes stop_codon:yes gene_type:complete